MSATEARTRTQRLRTRDFYHGMIQRPDVDELLKHNGEYLLRKTEANGQTSIALSVFWANAVRHFIIKESEDGTVYFEDDGPHDRDVETLIRNMAKRKTPITKQSGVLLKRSIPREEWVLTHEAISLDKRIGAGQFGEVYQGVLKTASGEVDVAIKTLRGGDAIENQKSFLAEARTMRQLRHDNVVRIFGVAVYEKPLMICMELCVGGSLLNQLRKNKTSGDKKLRWVTEAAKGLQYIASKGCLHRDIAARNCLLTKDETLKIADFGLTLNAKKAQMDNLGKVPIKWLAKETLELGVYSLQTDVWSYGILAWEIYADGAEPYTGMSNQQARAEILMHAYRMDIPNGTPTRVAALIVRCWDAEPKERPTFTDIVHDLTK